jgi:hypothetical protein
MIKIPIIVILLHSIQPSTIIIDMDENLIRQISIVSVSLLNLTITIWYCWLTYKQKIKPALAMWIFFTVAVGISLTTYMKSDNFSFLDNILNTTDLALTAIISGAIYLFGDHTTRFSRFDKGCLIAVAVIVLFWFITKNHIITHALTQGILVIAYFPVISRLWKTKENSESFLIWTGMLLAPVLSLLSSKGVLATIYSVRAIVCITILMLLMLRVEFLTRKQAPQITKNDSLIN